MLKKTMRWKIKPILNRTKLKSLSSLTIFPRKYNYVAEVSKRYKYCQE